MHLLTIKPKHGNRSISKYITQNVASMSLSTAEKFECPYCMTVNDLEIDEVNDIGQEQIVDCQICCSPIELSIIDNGFGLEIHAKRDDE